MLAPQAVQGPFECPLVLVLHLVLMYSRDQDKVLQPVLSHIQDSLDVPALLPGPGVSPQVTTAHTLPAFLQAPTLPLVPVSQPGL